MRKTTPREVEAVLRLDGPQRFQHFINRVADEQGAWGLWDNGWALMAGADGEPVFPIWPARDYAELCRIDQWSNYKTVEIPIMELLEELLPKLDAAGVRPGVFPTPSGKGVTPTVEELGTAIRREMARYE